MIEKKKKKKKKKNHFFFFFFFFLKAIKFTESAAFCRVGRVTGNNNKFLLGLTIPGWRQEQQKANIMDRWGQKHLPFFGKWYWH